MVVKPTRSAKSTETSRRSAEGVSRAISAAGSLVREDPHSPQNFVPGALGVAHTPQTTDRAVPQLPQNLRPCSFSVPQLEQIIAERSPASQEPKPNRRSAPGEPSAP